MNSPECIFSIIANREQQVKVSTYKNAKRGKTAEKRRFLAAGAGGSGAAAVRKPRKNGRSLPAGNPAEAACGHGGRKLLTFFAPRDTIYILWSY